MNDSVLSNAMPNLMHPDGTQTNNDIELQHMRIWENEVIKNMDQNDDGHGITSPISVSADVERFMV